MKKQTCKNTKQHIPLKAEYDGSLKKCEQKLKFPLGINKCENIGFAYCECNNYLIRSCGHNAKPNPQVQKWQGE